MGLPGGEIDSKEKEEELLLDHSNPSQRSSFVALLHVAMSLPQCCWGVLGKKSQCKVQKEV